MGTSLSTSMPSIIPSENDAFGVSSVSGTGRYNQTGTIVPESTMTAAETTFMPGEAGLFRVAPRASWHLQSAKRI